MMRLGTPGFSGERLIQAREAWGLSATSLADLVGVSSQSVSHYEQGKHSPGPEVMDIIASKLNFPRSFFLRPIQPVGDAPIFWRSRSAALKVARRRAGSRLSWLKEIVDFVEQFFDFPKVCLPDFGVKNFKSLHTNDIEKIALECRGAWKIPDAPISNICTLLESKGIFIARMSMDAEGLDAFCQWPSSGNPLVLLGKDKQNAPRSRFDSAHELAHLLLHKNVDQARLNTPADHKVIEQQAHQFASIFLLPPDSFFKDLWSPTLDGMLNVKERWGCSVAAMIKAVEYRGLVGDEEIKKLWINYSRRGWKSGEPLDDKIPQEKPCLLRKSFELLINEGGQPPKQILLQLRLNANIVEELTELPNGFFSKDFTDPESTPRFKTETLEKSAHNGKVIEFATARRG